MLGTFGRVGKMNAHHAAGARMVRIGRNMLADAETVNSAALRAHYVKVLVQAAAEILFRFGGSPGFDLIEAATAAVHYIARRTAFKIAFSAAAYIVGMTHFNKRFERLRSAVRIFFADARKQTVKIVKVVACHAVGDDSFKLKTNAHTV